MINPSKQGDFLNSPTERANRINDPQFESNKGYFSYDLTHAEYITPRFGEITPTCSLDVVPADRIIVSEDTKLIRNQVDGNLLSTINQYMDSFFVSLRCVFPQNYEKLIPNPVHGSDLPNAALPQVPLLGMIRSFLFSSAVEYEINGDYYQMGDIVSRLINPASLTTLSNLSDEERYLLLGRMILALTVLSRGQLLDYLGYNIDIPGDGKEFNSDLQALIDGWFAALYENMLRAKEKGNGGSIWSVPLKLTANMLDTETNREGHLWADLFDWRSVISDILEAGKFPVVVIDTDDTAELTSYTRSILRSLQEFFRGTYFVEDEDIKTWLDQINTQAEPFKQGDTMNIGKILAYQLAVAQYYTNDHIDNVFNSDLYMENLRSVMYPCDFDDDDIITHEPVFEYNGRAVEYDYISYGGFYTSLCNAQFSGVNNRQFVWMTLMLLLRRSLRFGDLYASARPHMLAISDQLGINVEDGMVSPIDVTKNLLLQRYLNAANYIGQGFVQFYASMYGVKPSDTGCCPRYVSHKKIVVGNQITNNTADNQGYQTTNLVAHGEKQAMDVYCDDFGYLISMTSFDVLPVYDRGIDPNFHLADRFDFYNPMMENIGDQPIRVSELTGDPAHYENTFGYAMRNYNYKYKTSKAHGAFVNELKGFLVHYPYQSYINEEGQVNINPDFIRDKPVYLDRILDSSTGHSPASYYHFILACVNEVKAARKITATPSVLF